MWPGGDLVEADAVSPPEVSLSAGAEGSVEAVWLELDDV